MKKLFYGVRACVRMYIIGSTWFPQINVLFIKCKRLLVVSRGLIQSLLYSCYFFPSACICGPLKNQRYFLIVYPLLFRGFILCLLAGLYCCSFVLCISFMLLQAHPQTHTHIHLHIIYTKSFSPSHRLVDFHLDHVEYSHRPTATSNAPSLLQKFSMCLFIIYVLTTHVHTKLLSFVSFPWRNTVHRKRDVCLRCRNSYTSITHRVGKVFDRACASLC